MATQPRWFRMIVCAALLVASNAMPDLIARADDQPQRQPPVQRDDPATSGAGPTSKAPGQLDYDDRKGTPPTTTDSRGVTITHPKGDGTTQPPADQGNESMSSAPPK